MVAGGRKRREIKQAKSRARVKSCRPKKLGWWVCGGAVALAVVLVLVVVLVRLKRAGDEAMSFAQKTPVDNDVTFERVVMQTPAQGALGTNGAGCQWPVSLESSRDGELMLYGIDVAGLYKSTDHGATWQMANCGMKSRGVGMFAIDPRNNRHVLALGLGTGVGAMHISYDQANSWHKTNFKMPTSGARYLWDGLEFDPTTYDAADRITKDVYFSTPYARDTDIRKSPDVPPTSKSPLTAVQVGLYRATDGGKNFTLIINDARLADGIVKITDDGQVYVGNQYGLFLIDKSNCTIQKTYLANDPTSDYSKGITGLDVVGNVVYAQTWDGIYTLAHDVCTKITNASYVNKWPQFLAVSPSNPNHLVYQVRSDVNNYYVSHTMVSFDGGATWQKAANQRGGLFFQSNWTGREKLYIIDPSDDNNVITFGSDDVVRSLDGGLSFVQARGISNMMQGGRFNFNYYDANLLLFSAQDYTGVLSTDGGKTYRALKIPGKGNFYGGFAADANTIFGFANSSWGGGTLTYTHDGGATWTDTGLTVAGVPGATYYSSLQSPNDRKVLFAAEYYSRDGGYTWQAMNGCVSVFAYNYTGKKELYGASADGNIVVSYNNGDTWTALSTGKWKDSSRLHKQTILDLAYDHVNNLAYVVVQSLIKSGADSSQTYTLEEVYQYDIANQVATRLDFPVDKSGFQRLKSIAVDPHATSVVYIGAAGDYFSSDTACLRSLDGGKTWTVLTTMNNDKYPSRATNQGGYEVSTVRVNPRDGRVWLACGCYGYETFNPPY